MSKIFVTRSGVRIAYEVLNGRSAALPLVAIHGLSSVRQDWGVFCTELAKERPVVVFDNRGMGESSVSEPGTFSLSDMAQDTTELVSSLGWTRIALLGLSMGGMIAQQLLVDDRHPSFLVDRLVLMGTHSGGPTAVLGSAFRQAMLDQFSMAPPPSTPETAAQRAQRHKSLMRPIVALNYTPAFVRDHPSKFESLLSEMILHRRSVRGILGQVQAIAQYDVSKQIATGIRQTTLIVHGDADEVVDHANAVALQRTLGARAQLLTVPRGGHLVYNMDGGVSARVVGDFLRRGESKL